SPRLASRSAIGIVTWCHFPSARSGAYFTRLHASPDFFSLSFATSVTLRTGGFDSPSSFAQNWRLLKSEMSVPASSGNQPNQFQPQPRYSLPSALKASAFLPAVRTTLSCATIWAFPFGALDQPLAPSPI